MQSDAVSWIYSAIIQTAWSLYALPIRGMLYELAAAKQFPSPKRK